MAEINYTNYHNGDDVHYVGSVNDPCHSATVSGNWIQDTGVVVRADLIQNDAEAAGVIVPLKRPAVNFDEQYGANTWHYMGCQRNFPEGG